MSPQPNEREDTVELTATGKRRRKRARTVTGCTTCRARRVKCDEKRPKCTNCSRHPLRVCEYEFDVEAGAHDVIRRHSSDDEVQGLAIGSSAIATTSRTTLDHLESTKRTHTGLIRRESQPGASIAAIDPSYTQRSITNALELELNTFDVLRCVVLAEYMFHGQLMASPSGSTLADAVISKLPFSTLTDFSSLLTLHHHLVRQCFLALAHDSEAKLLCTATAILSSQSSVPSGPAPLTRREALYESYRHHVNLKTDNVMTGKLAGVGFTLYLWDILEPDPGKWRDRLRVGVQKRYDLGGPGWMTGTGPALPGYKGGALVHKQPVLMSMYVEVTSVFEIYSALTDGGIPHTFLADNHLWLLSSRIAQTNVSPNLPDAIEVIWGIPRVMVYTFAEVVALVSRKSETDTSQELLRDQLDFEAGNMRVQLEHVWPARLEARRDSRRLWFGARLMRLALSVLLLQKVQELSTGSKELIASVNAFYKLCLEASLELRHLAGWLWPILIVACAAKDQEIRDAFLRLFPMAKSPIGDKDNSDVAKQLLFWVWLHHDLGDSAYHLREAIRDVPSLDVLIL